MIRIKKMCVALITMGLSSIASAGMYETTTVETGCGADSVTVGCPRIGWDLGIEGMYVRTNDFGQATATIDDAAGDFTFQKITPKWTLGFRLQGSYHWSTANDMNLNWTHFNKQTNETITSPTATANLAGFFAGDLFNSISTTLSNHADIINFEVGQGVSYGDHVLARYHGGAQFARVSQDITQTGVNTLDAATDSLSNNSQYSGAGPRAGIDLQYAFGNGFSVVCDAAGTILYGKRTLDLTVTSVDPLEAGSFSANTSENIIVPGTDAKLGVRFAYPMSIGDFSIEGGYRIANYWQAVNRTLPVESGTISFGSEDNNFAYQGVYLGLYWLENG